METEQHVIGRYSLLPERLGCLTNGIVFKPRSRVHNECLSWFLNAKLLLSKMNL